MSKEPGSIQPAIEFNASRQFTAWLAEQCVSFAFTTYQVGKIFFIGLKPDGRHEIFNRTFNRSTFGYGICRLMAAFAAQAGAVDPSASQQWIDSLASASTDVFW